MQTSLRDLLAQRRQLADLGLAVSKINHDLRNILASAQLFSDRLGGADDPVVKRFAPKVIGAIDRAIGYTRSVLSYGQATEAPPKRQLVNLSRLVDDVADVLALPGNERVRLGEPRAGGDGGRRRSRADLPRSHQSLPQRLRGGERRRRCGARAPRLGGGGAERERHGRQDRRYRAGRPAEGARGACSSRSRAARGPAAPGSASPSRRSSCAPMAASIELRRHAWRRRGLRVHHSRPAGRPDGGAKRGARLRPFGPQRPRLAKAGPSD